MVGEALARYQIKFRPAALRSLKKLPPEIHQKIRGAISLLSVDPRPPASKKLVNRDAYRVRIGDYRIIYSINDAVLLIVVVDVGHKKEIYR